MRNLILGVFLVSLFLVPACTDDEDPVAPKVPVDARGDWVGTATITSVTPPDYPVSAIVEQNTPSPVFESPITQTGIDIQVKRTWPGGHYTDYQGTSTIGGVEAHAVKSSFGDITNYRCLDGILRDIRTDKDSWAGKIEGNTMTGELLITWKCYRSATKEYEETVTIQGTFSMERTISKVPPTSKALSCDSRRTKSRPAS